MWHSQWRELTQAHSHRAHLQASRSTTAAGAGRSQSVAWGSMRDSHLVVQRAQACQRLWLRCDRTQERDEWCEALPNSEQGKHDQPCQRGRVCGAKIGPIGMHP